MVYRILACTILLIFYGCYFIKMLSQRKKGIKTDQMGKGKAGLVKGIELLMKLGAFLTPFAELVSMVLGTALFPEGVRIFGAGIGFAGAIIFMVSVLTMRDNWRAGVPEEDKTELVTEGIYRISRNPAFLGFDLVYIGILLMFFNWVLCVVSVFAMLMFHLQIVNVEEEFLLSAFGEEYMEYKGRVCRYIGRKK